MSKILVLAEKPSVGKEIARVLNCKKTNSGYIEGEQYIVTWALGHLVTLEDPEHYGTQYKNWSAETLPMLPEKMDLQVIKETSKQYSTVKSLLVRKDVASIIIATDAGREGELVARWILDKAKCNKPLKRLWISSQTDKAIKEGLANLKDGREYYKLYQSAQARAEADWLVGLNVTRALTCKFNAQLSAGRVQTPTLAIIVNREEEIKNFRSKDYYNVNADLGNFFVTYQDKKNQTAIFDKTKAEEIQKKINGKEFKVISLNITHKKIAPPMLYDLTELQRDANKMYGLSPKETLNTMQRLYENHKALTYPRTDSRYLTSDIVPTLNDRLKTLSRGEFSSIINEISKERKTINSSCINNAKVSDHHAIIPTEQNINISDLNSNERRIYTLVVKRFLTCFYPNYEYEHIKADLLCEGENFFATGRKVSNMGWKKIYNNNDDVEDIEQTLPNILKGSAFICKNTQIKELRTAPPSRYTEATLLSAMENPSKFIEDKSMKEFIGGGLGTPATRADIIEKLYNSFYIEKKGNSILPTSKGIQLISLVPSDIKEPVLTAKWEEKLDAISKGKEDSKVFVTNIRNYTKNLVKEVLNSETIYTHDNLTKNICPVCGKFMLSVNGKKGKMLVCEDRNCGNRQNVSMQSNMRCPVCHKKMELFGDGEKRNYVCRCGFRERADRLHEQLGGNKASKQAVKSFLENQNKNVPEESDLALALKAALNKEK